MQKLLRQFFFSKLVGKLEYGVRKKPLDFGGNPDHMLRWF